MLSLQERNDLRAKVLAGHQLSLDEAKAVFETLRSGQGAAAIAGEAKAKKTRGGGKAKKEAMSDEALNASLDDLL